MFCQVISSLFFQKSPTYASTKHLQFRPRRFLLLNFMREADLIDLQEKKITHFLQISFLKSRKYLFVVTDIGVMTNELWLRTNSCEVHWIRFSLKSLEKFTKTSFQVYPLIQFLHVSFVRNLFGCN
jgi:hypothetical protein